VRGRAWALAAGSLGVAALTDGPRRVSLSDDLTAVVLRDELAAAKGLEEVA